MKLRDHLPLVEAPESVWRAIESALDRGVAPQPRSVRWRSGLAAAAVVVIAAGALYWWGFRRAGWIETGAAAGTTLRIADIGTVNVGPNTRLRVVTDRPDQHRLTLAHGFIHAKITAPPRIFSVDTKSGTAVDLGCEYALEMDEDGTGDLHVSTGWVEFDWKGRESLVPAGAMCRIRPVRGPDPPYFEDASPEFGRAVQRGDIESMMRDARVRDTLTLWHLLSRVPAADRARVYDRIAALTPLPAAISRARVLALDPPSLDQLKGELAWKW